jgi:hypothetical protein
MSKATKKAKHESLRLKKPRGLRRGGAQKRLTPNPAFAMSRPELLDSCIDLMITGLARSVGIHGLLKRCLLAGGSIEVEAFPEDDGTVSEGAD